MEMGNVALALSARRYAQKLAALVAGGQMTQVDAILLLADYLLGSQNGVTQAPVSQRDQNLARVEKWVGPKKPEPKSQTLHQLWEEGQKAVRRWKELQQGK